jgi:hypothetical protein
LLDFRASGSNGTGLALSNRASPAKGRCMAATLGLQAESLAQLATDVRFVLCQVDSAYARVIGDVGLRDVHDTTSPPRRAGQQHPPPAAQRLVPNGGSVIASDPAEPREQAPGRSAGGG